MSCAPFEVLPGLCYSDKTGTYVCIEEASNTPMTELHQAVEDEQAVRELVEELQERHYTLDEIIKYLQALEELNTVP